MVSQFCSLSKRDVCSTTRRDAARRIAVAHSNVDAIYQEYPFLSNIVPRSKVRSALVRRWDESNFLDRSVEDSDAYAGVSSVEKTYFLDERGEVVYWVGDWWHQFVCSCLPFISRFGTIGEVIARMSDKQRKQVKYVVSFDSLDVILWKYATSYTNLADWLHAMVAEAHEKLKSEG